MSHRIISDAAHRSDQVNCEKQIPIPNRTVLTAYDDKVFV
jgi:hypothetical protein